MINLTKLKNTPLVKGYSVFNVSQYGRMIIAKFFVSNKAIQK